MIKKKIAIVVLCLTLLISSFTLFACKNKEKNGGSISVTYDLKCSLDDTAHALYLISDVEVLNESNNLISELPFYLYPNAYADNGGAIVISNVSTQTHKISYEINDVNMVVNLDRPLKGGESVVLKISSRVDLPKGKGRLGYGDGYYNLHAFYPRLAYYDGNSFVVVPYSNIGDSFYFSMDDMIIKINYPSKYTLAYAGEVVGQSEDEKYKEQTIKIDNARDVALSLCENFNLYENTEGEVKIYHYTSKGVDYTTFAKECIEYFNKEIGEYPFSTFTIVETPFDYGGMEYSGLVVINDNAREKEFVIAHEIIHQWFGISVGSNSYNECWVDESLTNFLSYYYMDIYNKGGYKEHIQLEKKNFKEYMDVGKEKYGEKYNPKLDSSLGEFRSATEYSNMVYSYGVLLYDGVYNLIGEKKFKRAIKEYYAQYSGKTATGKDIITSFSKSAGKKVEGIFNGYIENKVVF